MMATAAARPDDLSSRSSGLLASFESVRHEHPFTVVDVDGATPPNASDRLSALPGRAELHSALRAAVRGAVAVLFIDMDHFKRINDTQGHHAGDDLLVQFAARLSSNVDDSSTVARFGGDEFVVIIPRAEPRSVDATVARLLDSMRLPFHVGGREVVVSASIGVAITPGTTETDPDPHLLLQEADTALFEAKRLGRGRAVTFTRDLRQRLVDRVEMEQDLRSALEQKRLTLHYQPQVDLRTGKIVGVEALARWTHHHGAVIPASQFIAVAEECGLIQDIGRWAIEAACAQFGDWRRRLDDPPAMLSINISPHQLRDHGLVDDVAAAISRHRIPASSLCLELTESSFARLDDEMDTLHGLRSLGCYVGIDDFGTGYSSLGRLRNLPIEVLKIDRSFVRGLGTDPDDSAIVAAIMSLSLTLGLHVIAEGVERPEQAAALTGLGCPVAQGYLFARPESAEDLEPALCGTRVWRPVIGDDTAAEIAGHATIAERRRGHRLFIHEFLHQIGIDVEADRA